MLLPNEPANFTRPGLTKQGCRTPYNLRNFQLPDGAWEWASEWLVNMRRDGETDEKGCPSRDFFPCFSCLACFETRLLTGPVCRTTGEYNSWFKVNGWHAVLPWHGYQGWVRRREWFVCRLSFSSVALYQGLVADALVILLTMQDPTSRAQAACRERDRGSVQSAALARSYAVLAQPLFGWRRRQRVQWSSSRRR